MLHSPRRRPDRHAGCLDHRRRSVTPIFSVVLAWAAFFVPARVQSAELHQRPNVIVLLADDLGYAELGCQGNGDIPTPHIDSIAQDGVRFTSGYVTAPFCSASRAGLITGRYQTRFGYEFNPIGAKNADPAIGLPTETETLAEQLHDVGYATGLVGKWHLGGTAEFHPQRAGFDEFFGFLHEGHYFVAPPYDGVTTWLRRKRLPTGAEGRWTSADGRLVLSTHLGHDEPPYDADNPVLRGSQPVDETEYLTDAITREAVSFVQRHRDQPYFLYVAYNAVHSPMQARDEDLERFRHIDDIQRRIFAGMLSRLDHSVGKILDALRDSGQEERTLVWFLSDNGGPTRELTSSNAPLRGGKGQLYEGGVRIPFLVKWPGQIPAGRTEVEPVISLDIFATSLAAAGTESSADSLDGVNLLPWLLGPAEGIPHETLYWRVGNRTALRHGNWKLIRHPNRGGPGEWELYDLANDLSETNNVANSNSVVVDQLSEKWSTLNDQMQPPKWGPRN